MRHMRLALGLLLILLPLACGDSPIKPTDPNSLVGTGTVQFLTLEGGFWAIRGEDGITYDPMNGIDSALQRETLRVTLVAKVRNDMGSIRMVGPIVHRPRVTVGGEVRRSSPEW